MELLTNLILANDLHRGDYLLLKSHDSSFKVRVEAVTQHKKGWVIRYTYSDDFVGVLKSSDSWCVAKRITH